MGTKRLFWSILLVFLTTVISACSLTNALDEFGEDERFGRGLLAGKQFQSSSHSSRRVSGAATVGTSSQRALSRTEFYIADDNGVDRHLSENDGVRVAGDGGVSLNFVNAKLEEVVDVVIGDMLNQNYTIGNGVQGSITTRTNTPVPSEDVLPILENLLALNGASIVKTGGIWHVVPFDDARNLPNVVVGPNKRVMSSGHGVHFIRLEHAPVSSVVNIVTQHSNPGRQITADVDRNLLIFVGPLSEAKAIEDMIAVLDIDQLGNKSFAFIPVEIATVGDVIDNLNATFGEASKRSIQFVPIERLSAILAISRNAKYLKRAEKWVARFDRANARGSKQVFVYYVKNGRADELAEMMSNLFENSRERISASAVAPGLEAVVTDSQSDDLENARSAAVVQETIRTGNTDGPTVLADKRNNALVIKSTPEEYREIEAILARLDVVPLQVLIEVIVAEVSLDGELKFGVEWFIKSGSFATILSSLSAGVVENSFPGFGFSFETSDAKVVLNALDEVTDVDVISSPKLMVLDNQSARLQVGDQVPVATRTAVSTDTNNAPIVSSVELVDTGVILEVTPTVNSGGMVSLNVVQEVSEATTTRTSDIDSPTIQTRKIQSTLAVQSGETVALAGLMRDRLEKGESGVPGLKNIRGLGALFRTRTNISKRTELVVLITPHVVRDPNEMRQLTQELRDSLSAVSNF